MKVYNKLKEKDIVKILFFIFFIFQFLQIFRYQFFVQSDDFGYIANSAFFAGYNWNPYTGNMTQYFNIGFPFFSSLAFRLFHNPVSIYRCLLFTIVLWQTALMYLIYRLLCRFWGTDKKTSGMIALLYSMGIMAPQNGLYFMSEVPFAFFYVLALFLMLEAGQTEGKKKLAASFLLGVTIAFSYTVHTRFLVLAVVLFVTCLLYHLRYKEKLIHYLAFFAGLILTFAAAYAWVKYVQNTLYRTDIAGRVIDGNDALARLGYIGVFLKIFTTLDGWRNFIVHIVALAASYTLLTGGMIWIALVNVAVKSWEILKKKENSAKEKAFLILSVGGIVTFIGMNFLIAINGATNTHEYKWLTYYRYGRPFVGVIFVLGILVLMERGMTKRQMIFTGVSVACSLYGILRFTIPRLMEAEYADVSPVGWMHYYFYNGQTPDRYFKGFVLASAILFCVMMLCVWKKKLALALAVYLSFSVILTCSENRFNAQIGDKNYEMVDRTWAFMNANKEKIDVPVYFLQGTNSGRLRFALYDMKLNYVMDGHDLKDIDYQNAILLTDRDILEDEINQRKSVKKKMPKYKVMLDENEYIYTSDKELYQIMREWK